METTFSLWTGWAHKLTNRGITHSIPAALHSTRRFGRRGGRVRDRSHSASENEMQSAECTRLISVAPGADWFTVGVMPHDEGARQFPVTLGRYNDVQQRNDQQWTFRRFDR
jgi:hypothetical protein